MTDDSHHAKAAKARAESMTPERRSEIAKKAADARWTSDLPVADFEGDFEIAGTVVSAAVLRDQRRVITQSSFLRALGR